MRAKTDSDRAMCVDDDCPSAAHCLRHEATPAKYQVLAEMGRAPGAEKCACYIPLKEATE